MKRKSARFRSLRRMASGSLKREVNSSDGAILGVVCAAKGGQIAVPHAEGEESALWRDPCREDLGEERDEGRNRDWAPNWPSRLRVSWSLLSAARKKSLVGGVSRNIGVELRPELVLVLGRGDTGPKERELREGIARACAETKVSKCGEAGG